MNQRTRAVISNSAWAISIVALVILLSVRLFLDYDSDDRLGVTFGICTFLTISFTAASIWFGKKKFFFSQYLRLIHCQSGLLAFAFFTAHFHLRLRDYAGMISGVLLICVVLSLSMTKLKRIKFIRLTHKYGGTILIALTLFHGIRAIFFVGN